jgi:hypothetical protein
MVQRMGWFWQQSSLFVHNVHHEEKGFLGLTPVVNVVKIFMCVSYDFS